MTAPGSLLHELLDRAASEYPDGLAITVGADTRTYRELRDLSHQVSGRLHAAGASLGSRILVVTEPDARVPALLYGCARAGMPFVVLHPRAAIASVRHVLQDSAPAVVVTDRDDIRALAAERCAGNVRNLDELTDPDVTTDAGPVLTPRSPTPVDPVCFIYTSGTTALPRAVVSTHQQSCFAVHAIATQLGYRADDIVFCTLPLSFDYGLYQLFLATVAGAHVVLGGPASAGPALAIDLAESGATVLPAVPSIAQNLTRLLALRPRPLDRLRLMTNTGAALPASTVTALRSQLPGLRVQLMYGLTECKRAAIMPPDEDLRRPGRCGRALPGTELLILGEDGEEVPRGQVGEIVVRGAHVMAGYWRQPALTAQKFVRLGDISPALRTGDFGSLDDDGFLTFLGRCDDIYKERDVRVSAVEVAHAAAAVDGVDYAHVLVPGPMRARAVLVVTGDVEPVYVLRAMAAHLDAVKVPSVCRVVPHLPFSANGKVSDAQLAEMVGG